jgi:hypothetical protein
MQPVLLAGQLCNLCHAMTCASTGIAACDTRETTTHLLPSPGGSSSSCLISCTHSEVVLQSSQASTHVTD